MLMKMMHGNIDKAEMEEFVAKLKVNDIPNLFDCMRNNPLLGNIDKAVMEECVAKLKVNDIPTLFKRMQKQHIARYRDEVLQED